MTRWTGQDEAVKTKDTRSPPGGQSSEVSRGSSRSGALSFGASLALHALVIAGGAWVITRSLSTAPPAKTVEAPELVEVEPSDDGIELPAMSVAGLGGEPDPDAEPREQAVAGGGSEREARPDMLRVGRGGTDHSTQRALNLADSVDGLSLDRDPINRLDRSQVQRLRTARLRRSLDDRRATPNPMELSFLATGRGTLAERRPAARTNPSRGTLDGTVAASLGTTLGGPETEDGLGPEADAGGATEGSERDRAGAGVPGADHGKDYRRSAAVMLARPLVPRARAAVPAPARGRPNDTLDSSQEVASAVQSLIHASTAGGPKGAGPGGQNGPGAAGSGGPSGSGSRSAQNGYGPGALRSAGDPRLVGYFRGVERQVRPFWRDAFPDWAISEGRSGLATIAFTIHKNGNVSGVRVARGSGVPEYDQNLVRAVQRAAPFPPPPAALGPGPLELKMTFDALNPAVGREGPGRGARRR